MARRRYRRVWNNYNGRFSRRYYTRRGWYRLKKMANRVSLNYYRAKIDLAYQIVKSPNANQYVIYKNANEFGTVVALHADIRNAQDYIKYKEIYNEVMLTGVNIRTQPGYRNHTGYNSDGGRVMNNGVVQLSYSYDQVNNAPRFTIPFTDQFSKFFKNINKHWADIEAPDQHDFGGQVAVAYSQAPTSDTQCPVWFLFVTVYIKLRKNNLN